MLAVLLVDSMEEGRIQWAVNFSFEFIMYAGETLSQVKKKINVLHVRGKGNQFASVECSSSVVMMTHPGIIKMNSEQKEILRRSLYPLLFFPLNLVCFPY